MDQSFVFTATMAPGHRCVFVQFYEIGHLSMFNFMYFTKV